MRNKPSDDISYPDALNYIREVFAPEDEILQDVVKRINQYVRPIQIGAEEGKLLEFIIKLANVKNIVEVGTLLGYSTLWMARALPEDGHIYTLEQDETAIEQAKITFKNCEVSHKITMLEGMADKNLPELERIAQSQENATQFPSQKFDMIFIDADKNSYGRYLDWAEDNIRKGGIIVGDNTFLFGAVYQKYGDVKGVRRSTRNTIRNFNSRLADAKRYNSIMLPTEQGITIAQKLF